MEIIKRFIQSHLGKQRNNYIVPGLISNQLDLNMVRVFRNTRKQEFFITPHNHRFDLLCFVVQGSVANTLYRECTKEQIDAHNHTTDVRMRDSFYGTYAKATYFKDKGAQVERADPPRLYQQLPAVYSEGQWYAMRAPEFHTINFSPDAIVLFLEGAAKNGVSDVLLPVGSDGTVCNTAVTLPWMFKES